MAKKPEKEKDKEKDKDKEKERDKERDKDKEKEKEKGKEDKKVEEEVFSAITAFEQILDAIPNDRASLEALSNAYTQIGDHTKAKEYLVRLGNVFADEGDVEAARQLVGQLEPYADDPQVTKVLQRIEGMAGKVEGAPEAPSKGEQARGEKEKGAERARTGFNIADELSFAWNLMEAKELTQEEYSSVVQDLTEMSAVEAPSTVSVLHVLEIRGFKNLERILGYVSKDCGAPIISLSTFAMPAEAISILPVDFMVRRGAMAFEVLGKNALVVVMNPYDKQLRTDIASMAGRKCHFYLALPSEFDQALANISKAQSEGKKG